MKKLNNNGNVYFAFVIAVFIVSAVYMLMNVIISQRYYSTVMYGKVRDQYIAESMIDVQRHMLLNKLSNTRIQLFYRSAGGRGEWVDFDGDGIVDDNEYINDRGAGYYSENSTYLFDAHELINGMTNITTESLEFLRMQAGFGTAIKNIKSNLTAIDIGGFKIPYLDESLYNPAGYYCYLGGILTFVTKSDDPSSLYMQRLENAESNISEIPDDINGNKLLYNGTVITPDSKLGYYDETGNFVNSKIDLTGYQTNKLATDVRFFIDKYESAVIDQLENGLNGGNNWSMKYSDWDEVTNGPWGMSDDDFGRTFFDDITTNDIVENERWSYIKPLTFTSVTEYRGGKITAIFEITGLKFKRGPFEPLNVGETMGVSEITIDTSEHKFNIINYLVESDN